MTVPTCEDCNEPVDPNGPGVWVAVSGWAVNRDQGGANAIRERQPTGRFVCRQCGQLRRHQPQPGLF